MTKEIYISVDGELEQLESIESYDKNNNLISKKNFNAGEPVFVEEYSYNEEGKVIRALERSLLSDEYLEKKFQYQNDLISKVVCAYQDDGEYEEIYTYDQDDKLIKVERTDGGDFDGSIEIEREGKTETHKHYGRDQKLYVERTIFLDSEANQRIETIKDLSQEMPVEEKKILTKDSNDLLLSMKILRNEMIILEENYTYDALGKEIRNVGDSMSLGCKVERVKEWDKENLVDVKEYRDDEMIIHTELIYDDKNRKVHEKIINLDQANLYEALIERKYVYLD